VLDGLGKGGVDRVGAHGHLGVRGRRAEGGRLEVVAVEAEAESGRGIGGVAEAGGAYLLAGVHLVESKENIPYYLYVILVLVYVSFPFSFICI